MHELMRTVAIVYIYKIKFRYVVSLLLLRRRAALRQHDVVRQLDLQEIGMHFKWLVSGCCENFNCFAI